MIRSNRRIPNPVRQPLAPPPFAGARRVAPSMPATHEGEIPPSLARPSADSLPQAVLTAGEFYGSIQILRGSRQ
jgi:hypothetical protein